MNESMLRSMSNEELLRYVDRSEPEVRELCNRLEHAIANAERDALRRIEGNDDDGEDDV